MSEFLVPRETLERSEQDRIEEQAKLIERLEAELTTECPHCHTSRRESRTQDGCLACEVILLRECRSLLETALECERTSGYTSDSSWRVLTVHPAWVTRAKSILESIEAIRFPPDPPGGPQGP